MAKKIDKIIKILESFLNEAKGHYEQHLLDMSIYQQSQNAAVDIEFSEGAENLFILVKRDIYPYITDNKMFLTSEFLRRANYYESLSEDKSFKCLFNLLQTDIKKLYSLIGKEKNDNFSSPYATVINSLNTKTKPQKDEDNYHVLKELINGSKNFYTLDFHKSCEDLYYDCKCEILNINEIIDQYNNLLLPFDSHLVNKTHLIKTECIEEYKKLEAIMTVTYVNYNNI